MTKAIRVKMLQKALRVQRQLPQRPARRERVRARRRAPRKVRVLTLRSCHMKTNMANPSQPAPKVSKGLKTTTIETTQIANVVAVAAVAVSVRMKVQVPRTQTVQPARKTLRSLSKQSLSHRLKWRNLRHRRLWLTLHLQHRRHMSQSRPPRQASHLTPALRVLSLRRLQRSMRSLLLLLSLSLPL